MSKSKSTDLDWIESRVWQYRPHVAEPREYAGKLQAIAEQCGQPREAIEDYLMHPPDEFDAFAHFCLLWGAGEDAPPEPVRDLVPAPRPEFCAQCTTPMLHMGHYWICAGCGMVRLAAGA